MYGDQGFERLYFVGEDRLPAVEKIYLEPNMVAKGTGTVNPHFHARPEGLRGLVVPCVNDACSDMFA